MQWTTDATATLLCSAVCSQAVRAVSTSSVHSTTEARASVLGRRRLRPLARAPLMSRCYDGPRLVRKD